MDGLGTAFGGDNAIVLLIKFGWREKCIFLEGDYRIALQNFVQNLKVKTGVSSIPATN